MTEGKDYIGVGVGAFIMNPHGHVLLMKRGKEAKNEVGAWIIPGGAVNFGETLREAIVREVKEELGVEIELDGQLPGYDHLLPAEKQHWVTNVFPAHITHGVPAIKEPGKCEEIGWFALDALPTPLAAASQGVVNYFLNLQ
jgi:8-oxo-dGTP diphosphatase